MTFRPIVSLLVLLLSGLGLGCRSDLAPQINTPLPYVQQGIRIEVTGTSRGPLGRYLGVVGKAYNETRNKIDKVELSFRGIGFSGEELGIATASRENWPVGETWEFRARFPMPGITDLFDMVPGLVSIDPSE